MSLPHYFTKIQIIRLLCRYRAELAKNRHDQQFLHNISTSARRPGDCENSEDTFLCSLIPPRRQWLRPNYKRRQDQKSSVQTNALAIEQTIIQRYRSSRYRQDPWLLNLEQFIEDLLYDALKNGNYQIQSPQIIPVRKEYKNNNHEYRPIASYVLRDRIIIGQCAKYLSEIFDKYFLDCSYAFRKNKLNHHQAINNLIHYRKKYQNESLWVAECDIKGFFDCVHHKEARQIFEQSRKIAENNGREIDVRAVDILELYLQSYSFTKVAIPSANLWFKNNDSQGHLKRIDVDLKQFWNNPLDELIGIPQGGALSCLIANLMLDHADRQILNDDLEKQNLFYARYCDDMIVVHPDQEICKNAFNRYIEALKSLKLPIHNPQTITTYSRDWWKAKFKSKSPYHWADKQEDAAVPWIAFVGYQIRYDGLVRIRPTSIEKELKKQVKEAGKVLRVVRNTCQSTSVDTHADGVHTSNSTVRKSKYQIRYRLQQRFIAMSVGNANISHKNNNIPGFCWTSGFEVLKNNTFIKSQLRKLDRGREKQLRRVTRHIKDIDISSADSRYKKDVNYFGKPFSYDGQF